MDPVSANRDELTAVVDQKLSALMLELQDAGWKTERIASAINDVVWARWLAEAERLQAARDAVPTDFVSDGNEG